MSEQSKSWSEWSEEDHAKGIDSVFKNPVFKTPMLSMNKRNLTAALKKYSLPNGEFVSVKLFKYWLSKKYIEIMPFSGGCSESHYERKLFYNPKRITENGEAKSKVISNNI